MSCFAFDSLIFMSFQAGCLLVKYLSINPNKTFSPFKETTADFDCDCGLCSERFAKMQPPPQKCNMINERCMKKWVY